MWNIKSDSFGWNFDRDIVQMNCHCNFCKENNKCSISLLIHHDYRKNGKFTQWKDEN